MLLLGLYSLHQFFKGQITVLDIHPKVYIRREIPDRAALINGPKVHRNRYFEDRALFPAGIHAVLLLKGVEHGGGKELGHRAVVLPGNLADGIGLHYYPQVFYGAEGHDRTTDVIGVHILFQLPVTTAEDRFETVLHFCISRTVFGIQHQIVVLDGRSIFEPDIFPRQRHQENHGSVSVGQGMKDIQGKALSFYADSV